MVTMRAALVLTAGCLLALTGCGLLAGLKDLPEPSDAGGGGSDAEAGSDVGPFGDDATFDVAPGDDQSATDADGAAGPCTCMTIPAGWSGPRALDEYDPNTMAPACSGFYGAKSFAGNADLGPVTASCTPCTCGAQQGAKCGAHLSYYTNPCGSTSTGCGAEDFALNGGVCQGLGTGNGGCAGRDVQSFQADGLEQSVGSCTPSVSTPNGSVPAWTKAAVACAPIGAPPPDACDAGQVCAPTPQAPFTHLCISNSGVQSCPTGTPFSQQFVYYTSLDDTRGCTQCSCGVPQNVCSSSGTVSFWTSFTCTPSPTGTYTINNVNASGCLSLPSMSYYSTWTPSTFTLGSCPASGGTPTGSVTPDPSAATTFCCIP